MEWLNYHHLHHFWMAAREGSITGAARRLRLSQPTMSAAIHQLEAHLGAPLFERHGRGLRLTETGQDVFRYADRIFGLGQELLSHVRGRAGGQRQRFTVGIANALPKLVVAELLAPALRLDPPIRLVTREDAPAPLLDALAAHELDLVLTDAPMPPGGRARAFDHGLGESGLSVLASPEVAATLRGPFPGCLDGRPFLLPSEASPLRQAIDGWLDAQAVHPDVAAEIDDPALAKMLAQRGLGAYVLPTVVEAHAIQAYASVVIGRIPDLRQRFHAITVERRIRHPAATAIVSAGRALFET